MDEQTRAAVEACREALPASAPTKRAVLGFDGFEDRIHRVVAERSGPDEYATLDRMEAFGEQLADCARSGGSTTAEWTTTEAGPGGLTVHTGSALERLGHDVTAVGTFGVDVRQPFDSAFDDADLYAVGEPSRTDAVEFDDGKCILVEQGAQLALDWDRLSAALGLDSVRAVFDDRDVACLGTIGKIPGFGSLLRGLRTAVWPALSSPPTEVVVDSGNVGLLADDVLGDSLTALSEFAEVTNVTLSANGEETVSLADRVLDESPSSAADQSSDDGMDFRSIADRLLSALGIRRFVVHTASQAALSTPETTVRVAGLDCDSPTRLVAAGDHFNAGLALGLAADVPDRPLPVIGHAVAGRFVSDGGSPAYEDVLATVDSYSDPA